MGYQQQAGFPGELPRLLDALADWIRRRGDVAFVLHGGDLVDRPEPAFIRQAAALFSRLPVPTVLCLGNHDLMGPDALRDWLILAPAFFPGGRPDFTMTGPGWAVHVAPTQWQAGRPWFWEARQDEHLLPEQETVVAAAVAAGPGALHLLCTHSPVYGLPPAQTGLAEPYHAPGAAFTAQIRGLLGRCPGIRGVLGAHNHMTMGVLRDKVLFATAGSLVETPFEFKLVEPGPESLRITTHTLAGAPGIDARGYDFNKTHVQGRPCDRTLQVGRTE